MPSCSTLCGRNSEEARIEIILADLSDLSALQKNILRERYIRVLQDFNRRCRLYSGLYHTGHFIITVGSLIVPALMSIQYADTGAGGLGSNFQVLIYWITWVISLLVTTCNGIITLFKVDKKYYFLHTTCERLRSEGWQYFELTGRYSGQLTPYDVPSHLNQFVFFSHAVEKIKMRQIEEEYYKQEETHAHPQVKGSAAAAGTPVVTKPPEESIDKLSPEQPIGQNAVVPTAVKDAVNAIIKSTKSSYNLAGTPAPSVTQDNRLAATIAGIQGDETPATPV